MAETQQAEEVQQSTFDVMSEALDDLHKDDPVEETSLDTAEEVVDDEPGPELSAESDVKAPTYQEAEAEQEESSGGEISAKASEATEEAVQPSEERKARTDLTEEDAEVYGNLKPKAQDRFEHWINRAKEVEETNNGLEQSKQLHQYIHESTTNPEQLQWAAELF